MMPKTLLPIALALVSSAVLLSAQEAQPALSENLQGLQREIGEWEIVTTNAVPTDPAKGGYIGVGIRPGRGGQGVLVTDVAPESPAQQAGLKPRDLIVELNGNTIKSINHYQELREQINPGDTVALKFLRDGENREVKVKFAERQKQWERPSRTVIEIGAGGRSVITRGAGLGIGVGGNGLAYFDPELKGIVRLHIGGPGMILKSLDTKEMLEKDEYQRTIERTAPDGQKITLTQHVKWLGNDQRLEWFTANVTIVMDADGNRKTNSPIRTLRRLK